MCFKEEGIMKKKMMATVLAGAMAAVMLGGCGSSSTVCNR